jgi:hypothetical protein
MPGYYQLFLVCAVLIRGTIHKQNAHKTQGLATRFSHFPAKQHVNTGLSLSTITHTLAVYLACKPL